ncbi:hypothetical protein FOA52_004146 [Chlamydomonas sp. UWO 241]|nr:hypothetical protein FOA52_004146 [Chlamydomonas sp. UWO 241]
MSCMPQHRRIASLTHRRIAVPVHSRTDARCVFCTDCGSEKLIEVHYELTCSACGLVQSADFISREAEPRPMTWDDDLAAAPVCDAFMEEICGAVALPSNVKLTAKELFADVTEGRCVRGGNRDMVIAACVFFAQRVMPRGHRTMREIVTESTYFAKFSRECTAVDVFIQKTPKWASVLGKQTRCHFEDHVNRIVARMSESGENVESGKVRKISHKIMDKIKTSIALDSRLFGVHSDNIFATVIFLAYKIASPASR